MAAAAIRRIIVLRQGRPATRPLRVMGVDILPALQDKLKIEILTLPVMAGISFKDQGQLDLNLFLGLENAKIKGLTSL